MCANTGGMKKKNISQKNNNKKRKSEKNLQTNWKKWRENRTVGYFQSLYGMKKRWDHFEKFIFLSKRNRTNYIFHYFLRPPPVNYR